MKEPKASELEEILSKGVLAFEGGDKLFFSLDPVKADIKQLFLSLVDSTEVLGPLHPQLSLYRDALKKKVEDL